MFTENLTHLKTDLDINLRNSGHIELGEPPIHIPQLKKGIALRYGGTQFGTYKDLGDGRSAIIDVNPNKPKITIIKGVPTPLTKDGDGYLKSVQAVIEYTNSVSLASKGCSVQKPVLLKNTTGNNAILILERRTPFRIGTIEYLYHNHFDDLIKSLEEIYAYQEGNVCLRDLYWHVTSKGTGFGTLRYEIELEVILPSLFKAMVINYGLLAKQWEDVGFVHGALHTDNMSLFPEAIDLKHSFFTKDKKKTSAADPNSWYTLEAQPQAILYNLNIMRKCIEHILLDEYTASDMENDFYDSYKNGY
jgi:uncharacterized protein YdiU (UPF0061 family)